jgi:hypothetical protein
VDQRTGHDRRHRDIRHDRNQGLPAPRPGLTDT